MLPDGRTAFNLIQNATDTGQGSLVFFLFDLLHLDGENLIALPLLERKTRLESLLHGAPNSLRSNRTLPLLAAPAFDALAPRFASNASLAESMRVQRGPARRSTVRHGAGRR
jgi:ATP-dependent DNA ligase